jgi:hypothetical protein
MLRTGLLTLFLVFTIATNCWATNEEPSLGVYSYTSDTLRLRLLLDFDGVKNVVINGKDYPGTFPVSSFGRQDGIETYSFFVQDKEIVRIIHLIVLFGVDDVAIAVAGFYSEYSKPSSPGSSTAPANVRVFEPRFERIDVEELPSWKTLNDDANVKQ